MNFIFTALRMTPVTGGLMRNFSTRVQVPSIINSTPTSVFGLGGSPSAVNQNGGLLAAVQQLSVGSIIGRTNIRCHFPRPNERKRIKKHGWKARLSTPTGRRVIMRRILKGRHVLTH